MEATSLVAHATVPQHMQALARANRVRLARAGLKRAIGTGEADLTEVIRNLPQEVATMPVGELLRCQRHWGRTRSRHLLLNLDLSENRTMERLTDRQRMALIAALDEPARRL